jgi:predicted negative regulator of RcsB-dependent stress response
MAKVKRKQLLKEPDEFLTLSDRVIRWARENLRLVIIVASVLVLITAGILGVRGWMRYHAGQAAEALALAFPQYEIALSGQAEEVQVQAAISDLYKVVKEYGATPAGIQARLALGSLHMDQEKYDLAGKQFAELADDPDTPNQLMPLALRGLGQSQEAGGHFAEAAQTYKQALAVSGPELSELLKLDRARVLAASGDKHAATEIYRELIKQARAGTTTTQAAQDRLVALGISPKAE